MLKIVPDTNSSLRQPSKDVILPLSKENETLLLQMLDYLKKSQDKEYAEKYNIREGVGLAAPQVGHNIKMLVIYYKDGNDKEVTYALINPRIIAESIRLSYIEQGEGCLSVNNEHPGYTYRHYKIIVEAYDYFMKKNREIVATGFKAIVLQHEIDHLNGILFYDRIDKRNPFLVKENATKI